jgi:hypothetical protein
MRMRDLSRDLDKIPPAWLIQQVEVGKDWFPFVSNVLSYGCDSLQSGNRFTRISGVESNSRETDYYGWSTCMFVNTFNLPGKFWHRTNDHLFTNYTKYTTYNIRIMIYTKLYNFVLNFGYRKTQRMFCPSELFVFQCLSAPWFQLPRRFINIQQPAIGPSPMHV